MGPRARRCAVAPTKGLFPAVFLERPQQVMTGLSVCQSTSPAVTKVPGEQASQGAACFLGAQDVSFAAVECSGRRAGRLKELAGAPCPVRGLLVATRHHFGANLAAQCTEC